MRCVNTLVILAIFLAVGKSEKSCLEGWVGPFPNTETCYKLVEAEKTHDEHLENCKNQAEGGSLVSIASQEENDFIIDNNVLGVSSEAVIGLKRARTIAPWQWDDGTEFDFKNWNSSKLISFGN